MLWFAGRKIKVFKNIMKKYSGSGTFWKWENIGKVRNIPLVWQKTTVGIMIGDQSEWSKGYGAEAVKLILKYAFKRLGLRKVAYHVIAPNIGSQKVAKKNGFQEEARLKSHIFREGGYHDVVILSIFREDWKNNN